MIFSRKFSSRMCLLLAISTFVPAVAFGASADRRNSEILYDSIGKCLAAKTKVQRWLTRRNDGPIELDNLEMRLCTSAATTGMNYRMNRLVPATYSNLYKRLYQNGPPTRKPVSDTKSGITCIISNAPDLVHTAIIAPVRTSADDDAWAALSSTLQNCNGGVMINGEKDREFLRGQLARRMIALSVEEYRVGQASNPCLKEANA